MSSLNYDDNNYCHKCRSHDCKCVKKIHCNVNFLKNVIVRGCLRVGCKLTVDGNTSLRGKLRVKKDTVLKDDLTVKGNTSLKGKLRVKKDTHLEDDLQVQGNTNLERNLRVGQDLQVQGNTNLERNLRVGQDLTVEGNTILRGGLYLNIIKVTDDPEYEVKASDHTILVGGPVDILLPLGRPGQVVVIQNITLDRAINVVGQLHHPPVKILSPLTGVTLQSDGTTWYILGNVC